MEKVVFDNAAADYDSWYLTELGRAVDFVENEIISSMFTPKGNNVLEIGCGTGLYTARLAEKGYKVTALDVSSQMMAKAQARLKKLGLEVDWLKADVSEILSELKTYDGILSVTAFEFVPKPEEVLRELYKHLKPGGCLVIGIIAGNNPWSELYREAVRQNPQSVFASAHFYTEEEVRSWQIGTGVEFGQCLYFAPTENSYEAALNAERNKADRPGFLVAKWTKA